MLFTWGHSTRREVAGSSFQEVLPPAKSLLCSWPEVVQRTEVEMLCGPWENFRIHQYWCSLSQGLSRLGFYLMLRTVWGHKQGRYCQPLFPLVWYHLLVQWPGVEW